MNRRDALKQLGWTAAGALLVPGCRIGSGGRTPGVPDPTTARELERLAGEPPATSRVAIDGGAPRLFLNGRPVLPIWGMSAGLRHTVEGYRESGIDLLSVILGLDSAWTGPGRYDWSALDAYLAELLARHPDAYFLPRLQLNAPRWWEDRHPEELVQYGLEVPAGEYRMEERRSEGGFNWNAGQDALDPSLASDVWIAEVSALLRAYLRHVEQSPLRSRMMGYHVSGAMTSEWHYIGSRYLPDTSGPMQRKIGEIPAPAARMNATCGLLRDPAREGAVIAFYRKFHENTARAILHFAHIVKEETHRRVICGTFYAYLLENVMIQEAGHLAPELVLESPDIDFLASPYTYLHSNVPGRPRWESDVVDGAGNWLGRARGEGGDGGYRIPVESVKRHGKLFIVEWDPATYLEPVRSTEGGSGSDTREGTLRILQRDMGRMFASGVGGWFLDFGHLTPPFGARRGWYDDAPMHAEIRRFAELGRRHLGLGGPSVAQVAAVLDAASFCATQHWTAEKPWRGFGIAITDFFNHWFVNAQARTFHRLGAPLDFLFRFDLAPDDARRYKLLFLPNAFYLDDAEVAGLRRLLRDSGTTVVWYYAPGYLAPDRLAPERMEALTGFRFRRLVDAGPLKIRTAVEAASPAVEPLFGVDGDRGPRFAVVDADVQVLGCWADREDVAFAAKEHDGFRSVYVGTAPLPVRLLRWLAAEAGVALWCDRPDIVTATQGVTCLVATADGERRLRCPAAQRLVFPGAEREKKSEHRLDLRFGEVCVFVDD
ncbi:MAG: hypothetical protein JXQ29_01835 [Planctomycetes bacterium]|nr:hypothetical protein [Planctomycetota bacterium]